MSTQQAYRSNTKVSRHQRNPSLQRRQRSLVVRAIAADRDIDTAANRWQASSSHLKHGLIAEPDDFGRPTLKIDPAPSLTSAQSTALGRCAWQPRKGYLEKDVLWKTIQEQATAQSKVEPVLASYLHMTVIMHRSMEKSMAFLLANKLQSTTLLGTQLSRLIIEAYEDDSTILDACVADIQAVYDRDPACETHVQCMLFFKGFQAIQAQRVAHWMWNRGRRPLALALQSRMSEVFNVDIHPAATIGRGILIDHATGVVVGETAIIGDNVSMLHHVTLGGSGTGCGIRHPTIGNGALLGAGVSVLGPTVVGHCSKVGAGSVVLTDLPPHCVAVGIPARVIKQRADDDSDTPSQEMDQVQDFILDYII